MPYGEVKLIPGVNVEKTPTLLEAAVASSGLIRYRDGLVQKLGGWQKFWPTAIPGVPRDLHAWEDLNGTNHLSVGSTVELAVITGGSLANITPQVFTSDLKPAVQGTAGSATISIIDTNISGVTIYDSILLRTPISVGNTILSGVYPITQITGANSFEIAAATAPTVTNTLVAIASTQVGSTLLSFTATPSWLVAGMQIVDITNEATIPSDTVVSSLTATSVVMSNAVIGTSIFAGDSIVFTSIPRYTTIAGSSVVNVLLVNHGLVVNDTVVFPVPTTGQGVTVQGDYTVTGVPDPNTFQITLPNQASGSGTFDMNSGLFEILYYVNQGPAPTGTGYGIGGYGAGGYGSGAVVTPLMGAPVQPADWTQDNWGEILISCPQNGGIYTFDPLGGFGNAALVASAPPFNTGAFVSISEQILVCYGSTTTETIGISQDPLLVKWSTVGDFTVFTPLTTNQAGSYRIPNGSKIVCGMAGWNQNLIWTDLDLWTMNYAGPPFVFGFNKIGSGAGSISSHGMMALRGNIYWMGPTNFYAYTGTGVAVVPCSVWDFVFQNLNTTFQQNVRAMPNTPFNEAGWAFPSKASSSGECDSYVKFNISEPGAPWDYGSLPRSAWIDQTVLGNPIGGTPSGIIYQHETSPDADGQPLMASFTTGFFYIAEGEDFAFVDQVLPDFKWGTFGGAQAAQIQISFNVVNYPGDTPVVYGPYLVTQSTQFISTRFRGRQMSVTVASNDVGSFWRLGKIRYRWAASGRR